MTARQPRPSVEPSPALIGRFREIVGEANALADPDLQAPYLSEWRDRYHGKTPLVLRPGSAQEVSQILALANSEGVAIVPQAGNTGLVGGQIPDESGRQIVLSVARMTAVRDIDPAGISMTVEAGLTLAAAQAAAERAGRLFPLSLASEGSCQIGGTLATNAGGTAVLAYGNARNLVLGLEVVLADGRVWNGLRALKKDNTGYDLRDLFVGSEGTLGVITAATLKLFPKPAETAVALAAVPGLKEIAALFRIAEDGAGGALTAFEFLSRDVLSFVTRHVPGTRLPLSAAHPWFALIEISGARDSTARPLLEGLLQAAGEKGLVADAVIAQSEREAQALWRLRESASEAQKHEGGSIKHDVSLPLPRIVEFIGKANAAVERLCPGARPVPFGHFGDGNVHYNVSQPLGMDKARFLALWERMSAEVHGIVSSLGGSISAEHGIGQMKRDDLVAAKSDVEIDLMRRIKDALDPKGILNPGKVL